jgi:hypothetical protein
LVVKVTLCGIFQKIGSESEAAEKFAKGLFDAD